MFVDCFAREIDYVATEQVVKNIICNIVKSASGDAFTKTERLILNEKQDNKKREKAVRKATSILRKVNPEKAFHELSVMKKQAKDFCKPIFIKPKASNYRDLLHLVDSFLRKL
ncbi:MAG: hypothetical protein ACEY3A_03005 [Wolbachia sp.]